MSGAPVRAVALLTVMVLSACAAPPPKPTPPKGPTIISNTSHHLAEPPRKVFVIAHLGPELPDEFEDGYLAAFTQGIETIGASVRTMKLTGLELDRDAPERELAAFVPDVVFTVRFNERYLSGSNHRGRVDVQLADAHGLELWLCRQSFAFSTFLMPGKVTVSAGETEGRTAIEKLREDRVFPGPI